MTLYVCIFGVITSLFEKSKFLETCSFGNFSVLFILEGEEGGSNTYSYFNKKIQNKNNKSRKGEGVDSKFEKY